ncbi:DUF4190 domain-containing protein [Glycomyces harbinensis]|uniref:DUF4190 domain-containing protein n=1 Tax=Glycomyces harbinensis TaxID=58114 RepID=A0A1G7CA21_9ACTN|nr:DUF4190 domain-containing protein [Glycomyces harbinensis]SDE35556.1 hypothetical protein SAMN05216270_11916 [Glycomyces harbinensis]
MTAQDPYPSTQQPAGPPNAAPQGPPQVQGQYMQYQAPPPYYHPYPAHPVWQPVPAPVMIDGYYMVQPRLRPIFSGPAIGSLAAGIGGVVGAFVGLVSAAFSPWTGVAFFMFGMLFGIGSVSLAVFATRQIRASQGGVSGRGVAITGLVMGLVACLFAALAGLIALIGLN